jgi:hypothetical protein
MPSITISMDEDVRKIIAKRAGKNMLSLREQVEDIVRQSAVRTKSGTASSSFKADDRLVEIFSRYKKKAKRNKK